MKCCNNDCNQGRNCPNHNAFDRADSVMDAIIRGGKILFATCVIALVAVAVVFATRG